ncbi:hypothetical protein E4631_15585 [Hymenobacter sp. UV11]|uniref:hypothetical protein n=1 Tax=Hymenobacter sp. UV11 TaxID=1849735 RepID=UPI00105D731E|nr:hypothetical protein [Hymenobacter sp. UV11]TDN39280.1 hypothetical protein A8B98_18650 [Hymenobacter sp. UV11]TFZ65639.1 hypothetical protein E4631_15585 [Hymenobacter sp. UV11]
MHSPATAQPAAPVQGAAPTRAEQLAALAVRYPQLAARLAAQEAAAAAGPPPRPLYRSSYQPSPLDEPATDPARWQGFL